MAGDGPRPSDRLTREEYTQDLTAGEQPPTTIIDTYLYTTV